MHRFSVLKDVLPNVCTKIFLMKKILFAMLFLVSVLGCTTEPDVLPESYEWLGLRPIYVDEQSAKVIESGPPRPIERLGKIYYKDQTIYVNESNRGIHVIDNTDPTAPVKIKFLGIPGCRDIAIKGDILYADNVGDLVAIDISNLDEPKEVKRLPAIQAFLSQDYPEFYEGYFECVEEGKGIVVGWEEAMLTDPQCWR